MFGAASEAFSQRNINCSIAESIERFAPVVAAAREAGIKVRGAISCALGCPYQGEVSPDEVEHVVRADEGASACSTSAWPTPSAWARRARCRRRWSVRSKHYPLAEVSGHFHDTYGQALVNSYACLEMGVHSSTPASPGLGGCPYAKGATGNVATEDVVFMLHGMGIETGIDLDTLVDAGAFISERARPPAGVARRATRCWPSAARPFV